MSILTCNQVTGEHRSYNGCELPVGHSGQHRAGGLVWGKGEAPPVPSRPLSPTQKQHYIALETLRYIANRSSRPGWASTAEGAAADALRVMKDPVLLDHYYSLGPKEET